MKVSFGGIKNAGSLTFTQETPRPIKNNNTREIGYWELSRSFYHVELTNENGNDLDEFNGILKKYPNMFNPNSLDVMKMRVVDRDRSVYDLYSINDKLVELNEKNLKTYIKMFNLFNKISNMSKEDISFDDRYLNSPELLNAFKYFIQFFTVKDSNGKPRLNPDFFKMTKSVHNFEWAKLCSEDMKESLSALLTNFFMDE